MQKHEIRITVKRSGGKPISIAEFKKLSWTKKLTSKWFGKAKNVMVIVPQDSTQKLKRYSFDYG